MTNRLIFTLIILVGLTLFLAACGEANQAAQSRDEAAGEAHFQEQGCIACHLLDPGADQSVGPTMAGVASRSADTIDSPDYTGAAETVADYLRESIVQPNVYLVAGYPPMMPQTYEISLSEAEIEQLVAYMLSLE